MDLIDQMKALADKINNHYDSVTLETEVPIEDETSRILREAGIIEDEDDSKEESEQIEEFVAAMPAITSATKAAARQNSYTPADDEEDEDDGKEEEEVDETTTGWSNSKVIDKVEFPTGGVKKGSLKDLEKHNKDLRDKKAKKDDETSEEEEVDEAVEKPTDSAMTDLRHMLNRLARK